jgi:rhodanese-related sulfurtransferase
VSAPVASTRLASSDRPLAIDVRSPRERAAGHIPGSVHIPLNHLLTRMAEIPRDRSLLLYCAAGYRSSIAASLLLQHGFNDIAEIAGGMTAWETARLPREAAL